MTTKLTLTEEQARAISFAFTANNAAREELATGNMKGFDIWKRMRDESLAEVFGATLRDIHDFGHYGTKPGQQRKLPARLDYTGRLRADIATDDRDYDWTNG